MTSLHARRVGGLARVGLALAMMGLATSSAAGMEKPDPDQIFQQLRQAIDRFNQLQSCVRVEGSATEIFYGSESPKPIGERVYHLTYTASGDSQALVQVKLQPKYSEYVLVAGDRRKFVVRRSSASAPYVLDHLELPDNLMSILRARRSAIAWTAFSVGEDDLTRIVASKDFRVKGASELEQDGRKQVRLDFDYTPNVKDQFNKKGWVLLDPKLDWAVVEYEVENTGPAIPGERIIASGSAKYDPSMAGFPCPTELEHIEYEPERGPEKPKYRFAFRAEKASHDPVSPDVFTLTGYGLGELDRPPGQPSNLLAVGVLVGGIALLAFSLILKRLGRI